MSGCIRCRGTGKILMFWAGQPPAKCLECGGTGKIGT